MNFLFVDRIIHLEPGKSVRGIKHVTADDTYLTIGRNGNSALMSSIIGEALGQLGAWNVMQTVNFTARPVAGCVSGVTIYDDAYLGDTIFLETIIDSLDDKAVEYHSVAKVRDKIILTIDHALGPMLPMQDFIDPALAKKQFQQINRPGDFAELPLPLNQHLSAKDYWIKKECHPRESGDPGIFANTLDSRVRGNDDAVVNYDHILDWQSGKKIIAQKNISGLAPYFVDHFPNKPVLPLTMLLSSHINLARQFIAEMLPAETARQFHLQSFRRVKMSDFVQPGDVLITTMTLKQQTINELIFNFQSEVTNKRVCIVEAVFSS